MTTGLGTTRFGIHAIATDESIHPAKLGTAVEERGFDALFLADHSHIPADSAKPHPRGGELPRQYYRTLDPFAALSMVAGVTENLLLGTGVALLVQRDPIQTAKDVASLDFLSNGRVIFGIGAGWNREEMRNHGTDPRIRGRLLDERMAAIIEIWTKGQAEYHGKYVDFDPIFAWPKPVQRPHPPVYVGGQSAKAIARAERFGGWMPSANDVTDPAGVAEQMALVGPETPVIANAVPPEPDVVAAYREAGAAGITFHLPNVPEAEALSILDELARLID
ncbi:LLM class F420-dependent oxidoreductase [Streptantibioticus ferralitis]|uniref:LLM class F420-dependent oxidoreductase n=1 Tax=Streptantibioticus ferralitis TaxID=236510 RepID=A0ABT5Z4X7_9ACTN|nr:LLM class F420-dependent oxidoreductase [Streptantibioticus ferralitis]MDF2258881.1 LLM class F420-dependent oxidoreductase [Streptantibioticus ferralitis]